MNDRLIEKKYFAWFVTGECNNTLMIQTINPNQIHKKRRHKSLSEPVKLEVWKSYKMAGVLSQKKLQHTVDVHLSLWQDTKRWISFALLRIFLVII